MGIDLVGALNATRDAFVDGLFVGVIVTLVLELVLFIVIKTKSRNE